MSGMKASLESEMVVCEVEGKRHKAGWAGPARMARLIAKHSYG
jgi:hypothetical protein